MIPPAALDELKERHPVYAVAGQYVRLRRKRGKAGDRYIGPCPVCSTSDQSKSAARFECDADKWVCAVCADGGDVLRLVAKIKGLDLRTDFRAVVDHLGGAPASAVITPRDAERRGARDARAGVDLDDPRTRPRPFAEDPALVAAWQRGGRKELQRIDDERRYRERERQRLWRFWQAAARWPGTPVEAYLSGRGLVIPPAAKLRFHPDMPYFSNGSEVEPRVLHRGPVMLAAILGDPLRTTSDDGSPLPHRFTGLHITWLDPSGPKGKARIVDPDTGEVMASKKSRGTKLGGYIDLGGCDAAIAPRMIAGEGIETVLSVYSALVRAGHNTSRTNFRCAIDLGNLGGRALETVAHPTMRTANGRARRVPGPDPDLSAPAMPVPDGIEELTILGDGDSDPVTTRNAIARACKRHTRPGRTVRDKWADAGLDFNDMLLGQVKASA